MQNFISFIFHYKIKIFLVVGIGFLYAGWVQLTGWTIPCMFHWFTGWFCPGCGITHFCLDLMQGKIIDAVQQNLALAILSVVWAIAGFVHWLFSTTRLQQNSLGFRILTWGSVVFLVLFGVLRNLP